MEAVIEGKGLVKLYRSLQAADGIDPIVRAGEVLSLLGPNGEGKTTAVEMMKGPRTKTTGFNIALFGMHASINLAVALMGIAGSALFPP